MIHNLGNQNSILNQYIAELRDEVVQQDSLRFRFNLERISAILAYEISKNLKFTPQEITTPLGTADVPMLTDQVVIASILRAGLPMHTGMLKVFDKAENAFISAYRKYAKDESFQIKIEYASCPPLTDKTLIICDPMLATGASMVMAIKEISQNGKPQHIHIASVLASSEGVEYLKKQLKHGSFTFWVGAIDDELTAQAYIVPGLGDAGDLAFGIKTDSHQ